MSGPGTFFSRRGWRPVVALAYTAVLGIFLGALAQFYIPGKGFSYLIAFGGKNASARVTEMNGLNYYVLRDSDGYDGQYYAQIALTPGLHDPQLRAAIDGVPYRARRILFSWTAYGLGLGRPAWILQVFALQNAVCWLLLSVLLLHWFPPDGWSNFLRWAGVLFSFGMGTSVHNSLLDGPSLLLVALGVWAVEKGRPWLATAIFALGGLAKETNLLGAAALWRPAERGVRNRLMLALRAVLVAAPLALWLLYIQRTVGPAADPGARNFAGPFVAYMHKWGEVIRELGQADVNHGAAGGLLMLVALTVQFLFFALRPQPALAWWRVGASFAVLMVVLGDAVWEGFPGAASRVLLAMQLAFNVLVPRGRAWLIVLLLGNLTLCNVTDTFDRPSGDGYRLDGPAALVIGPDNSTARVEFDDAWYPIEGDRDDTWRWSRGDGAIIVVNPQPFAVEARVTLALRGMAENAVRIGRDGAELWRGVVDRVPRPVELPLLTLAPGKNAIEFKTSQPAIRPTSNGDPRLLSMCVRNLTVELRRPVAAKPGN